MPNYEIMLIIDPASEVKVVEDLAKSIFEDGFQKIEKLDRTELAYPINKSQVATYVLLNVETKDNKSTSSKTKIVNKISEFNRKVNINKQIWRSLVINLDEEKTDRKKIVKKERTFEKPKFQKPSVNKKIEDN